MANTEMDVDVNVPTNINAHFDSQPSLAPTNRDRDLTAILHKLGYKNWLDGQLPAINAICENKDVFCTLPPGSGKSLIYQIAGLYKAMTSKGITFVVTPLISLMKEQVMTLLGKGIYAVPLYFQQNPDTRYYQYKHMLENSIHPPVFVFITPERLAGRAWRELLDDLHENKRIGLFVLDEAQVILEWGMGYRPQYRKLENLKARFPDVPILALSGSMSRKSLQDSKRFIGTQTCRTVSRNPDRPNIKYQIVQMHTKGGQADKKIVEFLKSSRRSLNQSGIIYCRTPKHCTELQEKLKAEGIKAVCYYSKMSPDERSWSYHLWKLNVIHIIIATVAFGMGIDKKDVRFILHRDLPKNLSAYIQETGRAGRDGKVAECVLYYTYSDCHLNYSLSLSDTSSSTEDYQDYLDRVIIPSSQQLLRMCEDFTTCRRTFILGHHGLPPRGFCNNCDICCDSPPAARLASVTQQFIDTLVAQFRLLSGGGDGWPDYYVGITNLAKAVAGTTPQAFLSLFSVDDDQDQVAMVNTTINRERICRSVIHNLILQGVFTEYPVKNDGIHRHFYLKLGNVEAAASGFTVLF